ncbi:hypothetical protein DUNSADRAFT_10011 [Dunaliella salina]|uniref:Phosphodiesterase n=1 Tax=Dunaliella salina TaxID=3046 RepID=A0ABQ7GGA2_DUNSA|nr:hypothetical protein DUNSADRAFT_10011 [Dunaliella salina]|eukprot:KAF5833632.1 hypothetical protein DUNSADRAFT_10011 [Dunaliella salina]
MGLLQSVCGLWDFSRQHPWSALATVLVVCVHVGCLLYHGSYMCICVLLLEVACVASFMYQLGGQRTCVEPMKAVANEAAVQLVAMRRQNEGLADEKEELAEEKKELAGEKEELAEEKEELVEEKEELVEEKQELEELINIADKKEPALQAGSPADLILRVLDQMLEGEAPRGRTVAEPVSQPIHAPNLNLIHTLIRPYPHPCLTAWHTAPKKVGLEVDQGDAHDCTLSEETSTLPRRKAGAGQQDEGGEEDGLRDMLAAIAGDSSSLDPHRCLCNAIGSSVLVPKSRGPGSACSQEHAAQFEPGSEKLASEKSQRSLAGSAMQLRNTMRRASSNNTSISACLPQVAASGSPWLTSTQKNASGSSWSSFGAAGLFGFPSTASARGERGQGGRGSLPISPSQSLQERRSKLRTLSALKLEAGVSLPQRALRTRSSHNLGLAWQQAHQARQQAASAEAQQSHAEPPCVGAEHSQHSQGSLHAHRDHGTLASTLQPQASRRRSRPPRPSLSTSCLMPAGAKARSPLGRSAAAPEEDVPPTLQGRRSVGAVPGSKHYALDEAERMAAQQLCSSGSSRARRPQTSESLTVGPRATPFADEPHHSDSLSWSSPFLNQRATSSAAQAAFSGTPRLATTGGPLQAAHSKLASSACQLMHNLFEGPTRSRRKPKRVQTFSGKLPSTTEPLHLSPRRNPSGSSKSGGPMRKLLGGVKSLSRKALEGASTGSSSAAPAEPAPKPSARKQDAAWEVNQSRVGSLREVRKRILSVPPSPPTDPNLSLIDDEYKSGPVSDTESFHLGFFGGAEDRGLEEACSAETKYSRSAPNLVAEGADKAAAEAAAAASAQGFAPTEAAVEEQQKCIEEEEAQEEGECARQKELVKIREAAQKSEGGAVRIRKSSALSFEDTRSSTPMVDPGSSSATLPASIFPASARSSLAHPGRASKQSSSIPDLVSLSSSFPQMSESCNTCRSSGPAKSSIGLDESGPTSVTWMPSSDTPLPALRVHAQAAASKGIPRIEPSGYGQRRSASVPGVCLDDGGFCDSDRAASAATVEGVDEAGRRFGAVTSAAQQQQQQQQQQQVALGPKFLPVLEMERVLGAAYDSFSFDAFELAAVTQGHPLSALAYYLFHKTGLISGFSLHPTKLARFLRCIEAGYSPHTPYHNATHAADVVQTLHVLMHKGSMVPHCADGLSQLAALMAAVMHDYEHMGLTNDFLINSFSPLAIRYNDRAPLENHHLAAGFTVLHTPDFNFLTALPKPEYCRMRKMVIELVLATDMKQHFALVGQFKVVVRSLTHSRLKQHDPASSPRSSPFDRSTGHSQQQKSPMCRSVSTNLAPMLDPQSVNVKYK